MKIKAAILFLFLFGLLYSQSTAQKFPNKAAQDVFQMIEETEEELVEKDSITIQSRNVDWLCHLSRHYAKFVNGNYIGAIYEVTRKDIAAWKEWYAKNKENFSYYDATDINKKLLEDSPIIKLALENGEFNYSLSIYDLERYREFSLKMKD